MQGMHRLDLHAGKEIIRESNKTTYNLDIFKSRMDKIEQEQAVTKGVQREWRRNMENKVDDIYNIVKEWSPVDGQAKKETKRQAEEEI